MVIHWTLGGKMITGFPESKYDLYCAAIEKYGNSNLAVYQGYGLTLGGPVYGYWLINLVHDESDLSEFWQIAEGLLLESRKKQSTN